MIYHAQSITSQKIDRHVIWCTDRWCHFTLFILYTLDMESCNHKGRCYMVLPHYFLIFVTWISGLIVSDCCIRLHHTAYFIFCWHSNVLHQPFGTYIREWKKETPWPLAWMFVTFSHKFVDCGYLGTGFVLNWFNIMISSIFVGFL